MHFMSLIHRFRLALAAGCLALASSIAYAEPTLVPPTISSILVLPPTNQSVEVNAPYIYLSTITHPLAEKGYYVFPVAVVDRFMRENGLHVPAEMHAVPLDKLREHMAPDAVLYIDIVDWGQKFRVLVSQTIVRANLKLVDARTGDIVWQGQARAVESSDSPSGGGLTGMLVSAIADQIAKSLSDKTYPLARTANQQAFYSLPVGPRRQTK